MSTHTWLGWGGHFRFTERHSGYLRPPLSLEVGGARGPPGQTALTLSHPKNLSSSFPGPGLRNGLPGPLPGTTHMALLGGFLPF